MKSGYTYLVYDLETTGLSAEKNAVCEIAMCAMDENLEDIGEYSSGIIKVYDDRIIDQKALDHNGITREQLEKGRDGKEVAEETVKFIKSLKVSKSKLILCGQNIITFDNGHLDNFLDFFKKDLSKLVNNDFFVDTLLWGRIKHIESENYQLGTLCKNVGVTLTDAHRAINDTKANKELVKKYIQSLRGNGQSTSQQAEPEERHRVKFQF